MQGFSRELKWARFAAGLGAECVKKHFGLVGGIEAKSENRGIVTAADKEAEAIILQYLKSQSPFGIVSEEAGQSGERTGPTWVIDPLDGTTNFAQGLPHFAVSIALVDGSDLLLGVIVNPLTGNEYYAEKSAGAFKNDKKLRRTENRNRATPVIFTDHGYDKKSRRFYSEITSRLVEDCYLRSLGASTVELCHVAAGHADAFVCAGDELWDVAAGLLIAREAGYRIADWQGNDWKADGKYELVAHPDYFEMLVRRLGELQMVKSRRGAGTQRE